MMTHSVKTRAFSLAEILVSVAILAMLLVPLIIMFRQSVQTIRYSEDTMRAFFIAQKEVERLKHWNSINKKSLAELSAIIMETEEQPIKVDDKFSYWRTVEPDATVTEQGLNAKVGRITVGVKWKGKQGVEQKLYLGTDIEKIYY